MMEHGARWAALGVPAKSTADPQKDGKRKQGDKDTAKNEQQQKKQKREPPLSHSIGKFFSPKVPTQA